MSPTVVSSDTRDFNPATESRASLNPQRRIDVLALILEHGNSHREKLGEIARFCDLARPSREAGARIQAYRENELLTSATCPRCTQCSPDRALFPQRSRKPISPSAIMSRFSTVASPGEFTALKSLRSPRKRDERRRGTSACHLLLSRR